MLKVVYTFMKKMKKKKASGANALTNEAFHPYEQWLLSQGKTLLVFQR